MPPLPHLFPYSLNLHYSIREYRAILSLLTTFSSHLITSTFPSKRLHFPASLHISSQSPFSEVSIPANIPAKSSYSNLNHSSKRTIVSNLPHIFISFLNVFGVYHVIKIIYQIYSIIIPFLRHCWNIYTWINICKSISLRYTHV